MAHSFSRALISTLWIGILLWPRMGYTQAPSAKPNSEKSARSSSGQSAIIKTDGAQVYSDPSFDSNSIESLSQGERVLISTQVYGGYFRFYKVRSPSGKMGYISVLDVGSESKHASPKPIDVARPKPKDKKNSVKKSERVKPIHETRYLGLNVARLDFREEGLQGIDARETLMFFGVKLSGPNWISDFFPINANIYFHYGAPSYYDSLSTTKPRGYILMVDCNMQAPFIAGDDFLGYLAFGPLLSHTQFNVTQLGRERSLTEVNLGGSFNIGISYRIQNWAAALEYKYLMEKSTHRGFLLAIQHKF